MRSIPENPLPEYQEMYVAVRGRSTVNIKKVTYSVPSRPIGSELKAKIYVITTWPIAIFFRSAKLPSIELNNTGFLRNVGH